MQVPFNVPFHKVELETFIAGIRGLPQKLIASGVVVNIMAKE